MAIKDTDNANQAMTQSSIVSAKSLKFVKGVCELLLNTHSFDKIQTLGAAAAVDDPVITDGSMFGSQ